MSNETKRTSANNRDASVLSLSSPGLRASSYPSSVNISTRNLSPGFKELDLMPRIQTQLQHQVCEDWLNSWLLTLHKYTSQESLAVRLGLLTPWGEYHKPAHHFSYLQSWFVVMNALTEFPWKSWTQLTMVIRVELGWQCDRFEVYFRCYSSQLLPWQWINRQTIPSTFFLHTWQTSQRR